MPFFPFFFWLIPNLQISWESDFAKRKTGFLIITVFHFWIGSRLQIHHHPSGKAPKAHLLRPNPKRKRLRAATARPPHATCPIQYSLSLSLSRHPSTTPVLTHTTKQTAIHTFHTSLSLSLVRWRVYSKPSLSPVPPLSRLPRWLRSGVHQFDHYQAAGDPSTFSLVIWLALGD